MHDRNESFLFKSLAHGSPKVSKTRFCSFFFLSLQAQDDLDWDGFGEADGSLYELKRT